MQLLQQQLRNFSLRWREPSLTPLTPETRLGKINVLEHDRRNALGV